MKIIRNKHIPFKGFSAMNICGMLFVRKEAVISNRTINHEKIHTAQMKELGYIFFYILYLCEWIYKVCECGDFLMGYYRISFEIEAYVNEFDNNYLSKRKHFAQWRKRRKV